MYRLKELREKNNLSQADMGKILNVSQVAYYYYEQGKRSIPADILIDLADFYETSVDYLLGFTDRYKPHKKKKVI